MAADAAERPPQPLRGTPNGLPELQPPPSDRRVWKVEGFSMCPTHRRPDPRRASLPPTTLRRLTLGSRQRMRRAYEKFTTIWEPPRVESTP
jgi:hypothetical protein